MKILSFLLSLRMKRDLTKIQRAFIQSGMSCDRVALRCGVHKRTVSNWIGGHTIPSMKHAGTLSDCLLMPIDDVCDLFCDDRD